MPARQAAAFGVPPSFTYSKAKTTLDLTPWLAGVPPFVLPTSFAMAASKLDALLAIISSGVAEIKHAYASAGRIVPDLDTPYVPDIVEPSLETTRALVVAAASQLVAAVGNPGKLIIETTAAVSVISPLQANRGCDTTSILAKGTHDRDTGRDPQASRPGDCARSWRRRGCFIVSRLCTQLKGPSLAGHQCP
jgi:hypothetical protein